MAPVCTVILKSALRYRWITKKMPRWGWLRIPQTFSRKLVVFRQIVATKIRVNFARETQRCVWRKVGQTEPWEAIVALARAVLAVFGCSSIRLTSASKPASITASKRGFWHLQWNSDDDRLNLLAKRSKQIRKNLKEIPILAKTGGQISAPGAEAVEIQKVSTEWHALPFELLREVLRKVPLKDLLRFKTVSKSCKKCVESEKLSLWRGVDSTTESMLTAINYYIKDDTWRCSAYDLHSKSWKALKPFSFLPAPDASLFKEYSVTGHGGLMCADVSKLPQRGELEVFNPLTGVKRVLPPLLYPRHPVLVHLIVDSEQRSFKVVVAGSSAAGDEHLSKKVEVFDSSTSAWKEACDLPGPTFGLNEHQAGVCLNGKLFFISFLEDDYRRGVVAFDVETGEWLKSLACPIPYSSYANTLQLVESDGKVYLFSEQEQGCSVEHCIDELEFPDLDAGAMSSRLRNVVRVKKSGGRGLQVYPEHSCVAFGEGRLCIFNTLNRKGVVYEMREGKQCEELQPPPDDQMGENFFSLNPASFSLQLGH